MAVREINMIIMLQKLERPVLLLNKNWVVVGTSPVYKAVNLLMTKHKDGTEKAQIIDDSCVPHTWEEWSLVKEDCPENQLRTPSNIYKIPEVIRLTKYDKIPREMVTFSRLNIFKRDDNRCQYCNKRPGSEELTIDHVIPRSRGGKTTWENCVLACVSCNSIKGNFLLYEVKNKKFPDGMRLLKKPTRPRFKDIKFAHIFSSWRNWLDQSYWSCELENDIGKI